jgi:two-component system chemotaxis response regulator CheB
VLAIVLTGMGHDGRDGAKLLKQQGATIWTQEKSDCLIYGMPMAIDQANLSDGSYKVSELQDKLKSFS